MERDDGELTRRIRATKGRPMPHEVNAFLEELTEDRDEAWKPEHNAAMNCRDLEDTLQRGLGWFYIIRLGDESWSKKVQSGETAFDADRVASIRSAYEWWLKPCDQILQRIQEVEREYEVVNAAEFRRAFLRARRLVSFNLAELLESASQWTRGEVRELTEEVWGGVQTRDHC